MELRAQQPSAIIFNILFPFGIGVQPQSSPVIFDFEFDPTVNPSTRSDSLTLSPGVLLPLQYGWIVGMRAAFDINQNSAGFTPLVHKNFPLFPGQDSVGSWKPTCRCASFGYQMGPTPPRWASSCMQVWRSERETPLSIRLSSHRYTTEKI
jgi:hypothetical protein